LHRKIIEVPHPLEYSLSMNSEDLLARLRRVAAEKNMTEEQAYWYAIFEHLHEKAPELRPTAEEVRQYSQDQNGHA
jgi:hypothetical protein